MLNDEDLGYGRSLSQHPPPFRCNRPFGYNYLKTADAFPLSLPGPIAPQQRPFSRMDESLLTFYSGGKG